MKALHIRISLLAAAALFFFGCHNEEMEMSSGRHSEQHTIQAYFDLSGTRAVLEESEDSYDLLAKWLANDHIRVFYNTEEKYVGTDPIVVAEVTPDGRGAKFQYDVPSSWGKHDTYDVKIFTIPCFPAAKDGKLYFNASIIRQPLELFQVPVYSEGEVNEYGILNATFHHYYTYELLHISNTSDSDIEFSLLGFEGTLDGLWYKEKGSICIDNGSFVVDAPSTRDPKRESEPITIKPGESRIIVSAYVPNGGFIHGAKMVTKINGEYVHSSNTKTSGVELKAGHAYHMYAAWNGEELEFWDNAEEPLNVEMLTAEINPITLMGTFTGTVTNSSIEGLKSGFLFLKEGNHPEDYVEYDSSSLNGDTFGLTLTFDDFVSIAGDAPVIGTYNVSAYVFDEKGNRFHSKMLQFTIDNDQPESMVPVPEAIDLGLPSGIKWASFNLGASKPEEYGYYYAWGEIDPKKSFTWGTYKWCNGSKQTLTKYNTDNSYGAVDNKIILDLEDDAAFMNLGGKWRMPTKAEQDELISNCNITSTSVNGVQGRLFKSKINGNSVFIPANGYYHSPGTTGEYWSSSLWVGRPFDAYDLDFTQSQHLENEGRYESRGIRPVYDDGTRTSIITSTPTNIGPCSVEIPFTVSTTDTVKGFGVVYSTNNNNPVTTDYGDGSFISVGTSEISSSMIVAELKPNTMYYARAFITLSEDISGHSGTEIYGNTIQFTTKDISYNTEYVNLGLSVKWATCNLGSSAPHDVGAYYAWGETVPTYMRSSYKWSGPDGFTKYNAEDGMVTLEAADDAAFVNLGDKWRMPTNDEITELRNNCTWALETRNGVLGCRLTGPNGNSIFIPVSKGHTRYFRAEVLSSSLNSYYEGYVYVNALSYNCNENLLGFLYTFRDDGTPVRPVYDDSSEMPEIEVTPTDIDFGAVPYGTSSTKYVTVKNIGTGVLTFSVTNVSSPYSVETNADGSPKDYSLSAGESMRLAFTFTPNSATYMGGGRCTIVSNATESPISVTYSGQGAEPRQVAVPEAIDLGLSVQWASFNLGATRPEEYGDYYAWGETEPYYSSLEPLTWKPGKEAGYDWPSYKWCTGSDDTMTKYCTVSSYGYNGLVDGKTSLDPEDDAAYKHLGGYWRMPTQDEIDELYDILRCSWELTSLNGVKGYKVTGHYGGNSIFLPCAGRWNGDEFDGVESSGEYWTSSLYEEKPRAAYYWQGYSGQGFAFNGAAIRSAGLPIRPVYDDPDYNPGYVPGDPPEGGLD